MKTRDRDIRMYLHKKIKNEYLDEPNTIVIDELNLCSGNARIDIAVVNGSMHGYEIKSESDTLGRLPNQIKIYNQVMDTITIVTGKNHIEKVMDLVPKWWGVAIAENDEEGNIIFEIVRDTLENPLIDPLSVAKLLWRDEALDILRITGNEKGVLSKPKKQIWERLASCLSLSELQYFVREQLKNRKDWIADQL